MENVQAISGYDVGSARLRLHQMLSGEIHGSPLIDIGATSLTGIRAGGLRGFRKDQALGNPIFATLALDPAECLGLGSDFIRTGLLFDQPEIKGGQYLDGLGVHWLWRDAAFSPDRHPLETAELVDVERHPHPQWSQPVQAIEFEAAQSGIVIADAPCPGLLDMCFLLRNTWQFMGDVTSDRPMASALLEWSMETIVQAYTYMLGKLTHDPDVVVYCDDFGSGDSMFFSPSDFREIVRPRMQALLSRLRGLTSAAFCFHSCGAIEPILSDIADIGFEIVNLDSSAKGMAVPQIRQKLPSSMVLHGSHDLCALGAAVANQDKARVAFLITELAESAPVIAGPMDSLSSIEEVYNAARGAAFIHNLSDDDFDSLRRIGPVRNIIEAALEKTLLSDGQLPVDAASK